MPGRRRLLGVLIAAAATTAAVLVPVLAFARRSACGAYGGGGGCARRWLRPARDAPGLDAPGPVAAAAVTKSLGGPLAQGAWRQRPRRGGEAARMGGAEAEIVKGHDSGADPFARLSMVLRDADLDIPSKVLDPSVDISTIPLQKAVLAGPSVHLEDPVLARSLWSQSAALIIVIRRPGCWLCREAAFRIARMMEQNPQLSTIRLAAIVKESRVNGDGSSEVEGLRQYLPGGDVYVDTTRGFFRALGNRDFFPFFSREGLAYAKQRAAGLREYNIQGNLNGFFFETTLLGGMLLVGPGGQVAWAHQEGNKEIPFDELEAVAVNLASSLAVSDACQKTALADSGGRSWLEWAMDAEAQGPTNSR